MREEKVLAQGDRANNKLNPHMTAKQNGPHLRLMKGFSRNASLFFKNYLAVLEHIIYTN